MIIIDAIIINTVLILFPIFSYFLFSIYSKDAGHKVDDLVFDLAIYSSIYLILSHYEDIVLIKMVMLTIPLLIVYLKEKWEAILIISIVISIYYFSEGVNCLLIIFEFISYYILFKLAKKRSLNDYHILGIFTLIKIVTLSYILFQLESIINSYIIINYIISVIIYYFSIIFVYHLLDKCEKIEDYHIVAKELEEQKQFRESLFKITHEIKNPIAVCKGYLEMLNTDNQDYVEKYIPIIKQEIERSITLMNDFLELTKLKVECTEMNVTLLLEDVNEMVKGLVKERKIKWESDYFDYPVYINGDYKRLKQVLLNLIKNSIEAIKRKDGEIKLITKKQRHKLIISIIDNGIGMDRNTLKKIGKPYYTTKKGGTGLGVRLSKEIIEAHFGILQYKSKKSKGTTVVITLPFMKKSI